MEAILKGLRDLEGVNGTFLADSTGLLCAYSAESIYDSSLLTQVSKAIANAIDSVKLLQDDWETITAQFTEGRLLIRSVPATSRKGGPSYILALIADARLNPSFATVAIRVAIGKVKAALEANGGVLPASAVGSAAIAAPVQVLSASSPTHLGVSNAATLSSSHATVNAPEVAASGLSWSGLGGSSTTSVSGVAVADAASSAALTACTKCLAKAVGPMAKVFVKDAVRQISAGQPFSRAMLPALVAELEKNIEDRDDAAAFHKAASKLA